MRRRLPIWLFVVFAIALPLRADANTSAEPDSFWLRNALKAMDLANWKTAANFARRVRDPLARKYLAWKTLTEPNRVTEFEVTDAFMAANPEWPYQNRLRRRAEEAMPEVLKPERVLAWFAGRDPVSAVGKGRLAAALLATGQTERATELIRDTWIEGNFPKSGERAFYKRYRKYLTADDHVRRLDRLLWDGRYWPVRRMMWKVKPDWRALAEARISLRRRTGNVDRLIQKVPAHLKNHPGLVYERLRWRTRKGKKTAYELLDPAPDNLVRPDLWWEERARLARRALAKGDISVAYRITSDHRLTSGADFADGEWMSGWIALRFLGDHQDALAHFEKMYAAVKYPISRARGAYWAGRAAEAGDDREKAANWYALASRYPTTYYGQLAISKVNPDDSLPLIDEDVEPAADIQQAFAESELVRVVELLGAIGEHDRIRPFILRLFSLNEDRGWRALTAALARRNNRPDLSVSVAKRSSRDGWEMIEAGYPTLEPPPLPKMANLRRPERPFVLAVIRQESAFRVDAKSRARALGLMQLMPRTAKKVAKQLKVKFYRTRLTRDPNYNMKLGQSYMAEMLAGFDNSYVLALAAYNAGPNRAKRWVKAFGDPRDPDVGTIDWVEMIPFEETRKYVQRVLENLQVYRSRLAETEVALRLDDDLHN